MFIVKTDHGEVVESPDQIWLEIMGAIYGAYLVHPGLNLSVGVHGQDRYAFLCEGIAVLQSGENFQRIAEHLYGVKGDQYIHLTMHRTGEIFSEILDQVPDIADHIWRGEVKNG